MRRRICCMIPPSLPEPRPARIRLRIGASRRWSRRCARRRAPCRDSQRDFSHRLTGNKADFEQAQQVVLVVDLAAGTKAHHARRRPDWKVDKHNGRRRSSAAAKGTGMDERVVHCGGHAEVATNRNHSHLTPCGQHASCASSMRTPCPGASQSRAGPVRALRRRRGVSRDSTHRPASPAGSAGLADTPAIARERRLRKLWSNVTIGCSTKCSRRKSR